MLEVSRYIHLNSVEARIAHLSEHYRWGSFYLYKQPQTHTPPFMNIDALLQCFLGTKEEQKKKYVEFGKNESLSTKNDGIFL
ncbi:MULTISPECIES: hypothetical protein [Anoxybacillus]|uniref:hypothetical protein n=1 Tax=Anoxybacillus TaxID=150247 RepID=UPI00039E401B|nr:hypothetical protein [Anoxybacillus flavithermus]